MWETYAEIFKNMRTMVNNENPPLQHRNFSPEKTTNLRNMDWWEKDYKEKAYILIKSPSKRTVYTDA